MERAEDQARKERELVRQKRIDEVAAELEKVEAEEKKIRLLRREVLAWHRAERIRKYAVAARESAVKDTEWIAWAERQADRLDPLKETPKSIVDDREEVLRLFNPFGGVGDVRASPAPAAQLCQIPKEGSCSKSTGAAHAI